MRTQLSIKWPLILVTVCLILLVIVVNMKPIVKYFNQQEAVITQQKAKPLPSVKKDYSHDFLSSLLENTVASSGKKYKYDEVGNLVSKTDEYGNTRIYTYNASNRVSQLDKTVDGVKTTIKFLYNAKGQRTLKIINGISTTYLTDGSHISSPFGMGGIPNPMPSAPTLQSMMEESATPSRVISEADNNGKIFAEYFYDPRNGRPRFITRNDTGETYQYYYDAQGNAKAMVNSNDQAVARFDYDPLGNLIYVMGDITNDALFIGQEYDDESALDYLNSNPATRLLTQKELNQLEDQGVDISSKHGASQFTDIASLGAAGFGLFKRVSKKGRDFALRYPNKTLTQLKIKGFRDYVQTVLGNSQFRKNGIHFDAVWGNRWVVVKAGNYWNKYASSPAQMQKWKRITKEAQRVANKHDKSYMIITNSPLPFAHEDWLGQQEIKTIVLLD